MSPLNDLNPSDIERIEIVKGAAAATLYGSEASAGVIQIFTKKGSQGSARWTLTSDHGVDWVRPFGSEQRPFINLDPWLQNAYGTRNSLAVSGGVAEVRYFLSGGYDVGDGVLPNDHENRLALRANVDLTARPDLTLQFNTAFTQHDLEITHTGNSGMALPFNAFRQPNNSFGSDDPAVLSQLLDAEIHQANTRFTAGFTATWTPVERVTQRLTVGLDRVNTHGTQLRPLGFALEPLGALSDIRWQSEALTLDYVGSVDVLRGSALASTLSWGAQSVSTEESTVDTYGTGFPGPGLQTLSSVAERTVYGGGSRIISAGLFGQGLVAWQDRIFLTAGARVDGTSTFGQDLGLQVYPKASLSWVISEEGFWPTAGGSVKLRAAYGWAGRAPGAFDAVRTWMAGSFGGESSFLPGECRQPEPGRREDPRGGSRLRRRVARQSPHGRGDLLRSVDHRCAAQREPDPVDGLHRQPARERGQPHEQGRGGGAQRHGRAERRAGGDPGREPLGEPERGARRGWHDVREHPGRATGAGGARHAGGERRCVRRSRARA
jgi:TonB-dependent starch-binding outer membrane protein SusC